MKEIHICEVDNGWTIDLQEDCDDETAYLRQRMVATTRDQALAIACAMMDGSPMPEAKQPSKRKTF